MSTKNRVYSNILISVIILYLIFPSPIENSQFLLYPFISILIFFLVIINSEVLLVSLDFKLVSIILFLLSISIIIILSILFNQENVQITSFIHSAKPIFFILILLFTYLFSSVSNETEVFKKLCTLALFILIFELIISGLQLINFPFVNLIYDSDKAAGIGGKLRVVGTLNNPNIMAWTVTQMAVLLLLFEDRKLLKWIGVIVAVLLVVLSGSRSFLIILPIILSFILIFKSINSIYRLLISVPVFLVMILLSLQVLEWFINRYQTVFPYLSQLITVFETRDLRSVNSFNLRISIWENGLDRLGDSWLFGVGPNAIKYGLDNDYLYALINYGILYFIIQFIMYLFILYIFIRHKNIKIKLLGLQAILFTTIISFQADTISGWFYPILIMFYIGIALGLSSYKKKLTNIN